LAAAGVRRGVHGSILAGSPTGVVVTPPLTGAYGSGLFPCGRYRPIKGAAPGTDGCRRCVNGRGARLRISGLVRWPAHHQSAGCNSRQPSGWT